MIYKQQSVSETYFKLMLDEALRRDLDCILIANDILDFKNTISDSSISNSISPELTSNPPTEIVHPGTGQTPR